MKIETMLDTHMAPTNINVIMDIPRISIIIPLYNKAPYIKRALDSVLEQTVQNFEIIVVNDGSTDGGEKVVTEMKDSRIHLINQENQGVSAARNNGVSVAHADLVAFLDADDEWLPEFLETILELRKKYPNAGLYGTEVLIENNNRLNEYHKKKPIKSLDGIIPSYYRYCAYYSHPIIVIASAVPKCIFQEVNGFNQSFIAHEDYDFFDKVAYLHDIAYSIIPKAINHISASNVQYRLNKINSNPCIPFVDYINSISIIEVKKHKDFKNIQLYLKSLKLLKASIIFRYDKKKAQKLALSVHSIKLFYKKKDIFVQIFLPDKIYRKLQYIYHQFCK